MLPRASRDSQPRGFDGVVFAGGGCRCFWQAGFYSEVQPALQIEPRAVAAASAGASLAAVALTGLAPRALEVFRGIAGNNASNVHWRSAFRGQPIFPHAALFRSAILQTLDDATLQVLRSGPQLRIALTRPPRSPVGLVPSMLAGFCAYQLDRIVTGRIHTSWPGKLGFRLEWANANDCQTLDELADLLLHTSCTPPFTPRLRRAGHPVIDGGLMSNVPVTALPDCDRILVLLTRPHPRLPPSGRVHYVQPSQPISIEKWDYTRPQGIQDAFDLGRRDGAAFVRASESTPRVGERS